MCAPACTGVCACDCASMYECVCACMCMCKLRVCLRRVWREMTQTSVCACKGAHAHAHTLRGVHAITHIHVHFTQAVLARDNCIRLLDTERWTILQRFSGFRCTQQHIRCDLSPDGRVPAHGIWPAFSFSLSGSFLPPPTTKKCILTFCTCRTLPHVRK